MKPNVFFPALLALLTLSSHFASGDAPPPSDPTSFLWDCHRVDSHAPIGVMGEHTHRAGEWMLSYRYMFMNMEGMRVGTESVSSQDVFALGHLVSPTDMQMDMHMLGTMFAPTDWLTLMVMANYLEVQMDHATRPGFPPAAMRGSEFRTRSREWSDTRFTALLKFLDRDRKRAHAHLGFSAPTGSIDEVDDDFNGGQLPYPMQTGSGTWDLLVGLTFLEQFDSWSYGIQGLGTVRGDENDQGYALGDRFDATAWLAVPLSSSFSVSGRIAYATQGDIEGTDPRLAAARALGMGGVGLVPTVVTDNFAKDQVDLSLGFNWMGTSGFLQGHRFALEAGVPVYRHHTGPLLETDYWVTVGWQKAF